MKILISDKIELDLFCKNPVQILEKSNNGCIEILKNNNILFYVMNPYVLKKIFNIQYTSLHENKKQHTIEKKFSMHPQWVPDKDFIRQAALWGIMLNKEISDSELACFISYWEAEGCFFYHVQWQQKLARSLQKSRSMKYVLEKKRDITHIPIPDQTVPDGFRGK